MDLPLPGVARPGGRCGLVLTAAQVTLNGCSGRAGSSASGAARVGIGMARDCFIPGPDLLSDSIWSPIPTEAEPASGSRSRLR